MLPMNLKPTDKPPFANLHALAIWLLSASNFYVFLTISLFNSSLSYRAKHLSSSSVWASCRSLQMHSSFWQIQAFSTCTLSASYMASSARNCYVVCIAGTQRHGKLGSSIWSRVNLVNFPWSSFFSAETSSSEATFSKGLGIDTTWVGLTCWFFLFVPFPQ